MRYQGIVFDLDGVICATDEYHYQAWKKLADNLKIPFDRQDNNRLRGVSRMGSLAIILEKYHGPTLSEEDKEKLADTKNMIYRSLLAKMTPNDVSIDVKKTLLEFRKHQVKMAIGSASKNARFILSKIGLDNFFDAVVDGNEITHGKPDPEVFLRAAKKLNLSPKFCLVVEDADSGIEAAKRGGFDRAGIQGAAFNPNTTFPLKKFSDLLAVEFER